ncbi:hypothetical protein SKDZ_07G5140 [Saccharomyces kudriavzevii ZP591]|uniref:Rtt102p n=1 Tax=Saccharomyces cerevisiae x Saccharomyces kudriavzevii (strain VIN7) TaxID=1095631 RepID=H0GVG3_SACCK|nr:Rtt102p [Saccharomyces cerevisiae x Saccharomyces kudriavzevii VIN7]CAI4063068.1 hypothetical protein SKDZ_07G5140 [Saccharomyces kudriavzevii ZP591]
MDPQTLIIKANKVSYYGSSIGGESWRYDWFQPSKISSTAQQPQQQAGNFENNLEKYPFKYKTWLKNQENEKSLQEGDCEDILDLTQFDRTIRKKSPNPSHVKGDANSSAPSTNQENEALSMDDIRGAVGNSEAIPGLSAGVNNEKPEQSKDVEMN